MLASSSNPTSPAPTLPYIPLPNEQTLYTSSPRIALNINIPAHFPGKQQQPFSRSSSGGQLYLTTRRIIFLPDKSTPQLQSFAAPILSLHDSHVTAPWFGPNVWAAALQPTEGGGIPIPPGGVAELKFTFKEGGAFDFQTRYERIRERLQQAVEAARSNGDAPNGGIGAASGVEEAGVHLEYLPAYQEESDGPLMPPIASVRPVAQANGGDSSSSRTAQTIPSEPPPNYEEAQTAGPHGDDAGRANAAA